jgi:hypothetical protein
MGDHGGRAGPARPPRRRWRPYLAALVGVLALTLAVAACGGGDKPSGVASLGSAASATTTTAAGGGQARKPTTQDQQQALDWARCMRQHGINLPDPQISGDMILQDLGDNDEDDPKVKAAQEACKQHQPNGGQAQRPNSQQQQRMLSFARCMRQHGISMPDPKITAEGILQELPRGLDPDDPRLSAAEHACHQYGSLPPINGAQPGGGGK